MGYHIKTIKRGKLGETSKIQEELDELIDAEQQNCKILALCELSDLIGSIESYLELHFPEITIADLVQMSNLTKKAFRDGTRS